MIGMLKKWLREDDAVAAIEAALLLPLMLMMLMGVIDLGRALNVNQKVGHSAALMADLLARDEDVSPAEFNDAVAGGQLAFAPYDTAPMGYDIAGVQFLTIAKNPTVMWRRTFNMNPNGNITTDTAAIAAESFQNEGVVAVTVRYLYTPLFAQPLVGTVEMQEVFYTRGRQSVFVTGTCCP